MTRPCKYTKTGEKKIVLGVIFLSPIVAQALVANPVIDLPKYKDWLRPPQTAARLPLRKHNL